jgi:hypothetical protein
MMRARPKYAIGTRIRLLGGLAPGSGGEFAIVSRHFLDTSDPRYRIRNLVDHQERSVGEKDIAASVELTASKILPFPAL